MRGRSRHDDGWDEGRTDRQDDGRRDSWQNSNGYQPDTAAGYQGTGYPNGAGYANSAGYANQDNYAAQTGYGRIPPAALKPRIRKMQTTIATIVYST